MLTFNRAGEVEPGVVFLQIKATESLNVAGRANTVAFRVSSKDLNAWRKQDYPVVLIVYDAKSDVAY